MLWLLSVFEGKKLYGKGKKKKLKKQKTIHKANRAGWKLYPSLLIIIMEKNVNMYKSKDPNLGAFNQGLKQSLPISCTYQCYGSVQPTGYTEL